MMQSAFRRFVYPTDTVKAPSCMKTSILIYKWNVEIYVCISLIYIYAVVFWHTYKECESYYLKIYRISPFGCILTNTFGTVTNWKCASFAFGKKTSGFQIALTNAGSARSRDSVIFSCFIRGSSHLCRR